jgi:hypothetical protein
MLLDCGAMAASGALRVTGEPGGVIHLANGKVTAVNTPGAPDPEVILLRSGRVPEAGWSAAFATAAADGRMAAELVRRELIGAGQLEALLRAALADAMFTLTAGQVDECRLEEAAATPLLPLEPAADPGWLLAETSRRVAVLAARPTPIVHDRDRVASVPGAWAPGTGPGADLADIVALANGRRTARDIAFVLGRGVYAVTLQLARMCEAGVLEIDSSRRAPAAAAGPEPAAEAAAGDDPASTGLPLPRRRRGSAGGPGLRPAPRQLDRSAVLRILRPGSGAHRQPDKQPDNETP